MDTKRSRGTERRLGATIVVAMLAVVACGQLGPAPSPARPAPPAEGSALDAEIAASTSTRPPDEADLADQYNRDMMQFMSQCMGEQGFEYTPIELPPSAPHLNGRRLSEADFAKELGYGMAANIDGGLPARLTPDVPSEDPNMDRRMAMSDKERAAYDAAFGVCVLRVGDEVPLPPGSFHQPPGTEDEFAELNTRLAADPRVVAATRAWSGCMVARGFSYDSPDDALQDIIARVAPIKSAYETSGGRTFGDRPDGVAAATEPEVAEILTAGERAKLATVETYERDVAVADYECNADLTRIRDAVFDEYVAEILSKAGD